MTDLDCDNKSCIEMKTLPRQESTASTDTYASCFTHPQSSPSITGRPNDAPNQANICVNPLEDPYQGQLPSYEAVMRCDFINSTSNQENANINYQKAPPLGIAVCQSFSGSVNRPSDQIIQKIEDGLTATWQRNVLASSGTTPSSSVGDIRARMGSHSGGASTMTKTALKRYKSLSGEKHPRFADPQIERTYSSTDNLHRYSKPKLKFRKASSLSSRLHASPATGKKLANYHLIAHSKSDKTKDNSSTDSYSEQSSSLRRSTPTIISESPVTLLKKSILKKDALNREETENLLGNIVGELSPLCSQTCRPKHINKPVTIVNDYETFNNHSNNEHQNHKQQQQQHHHQQHQLHHHQQQQQQNHQQQQLVTATPLTTNISAMTATPPINVIAPSIDLSEEETGAMAISCTPTPSPPGVTEDTDTPDSDSQSNFSEDREGEELEFSDSAASLEKLKCWKDLDNKEQPLLWQQDTSPSDNMDNDESYQGTNSVNQSASDISLMEQPTSRSSPSNEGDTHMDIDKFGDKSADYMTEKMTSLTAAHNGDYPLDNLINDIEKTSDDPKENVVSADASG